MNSFHLAKIRKGWNALCTCGLKSKNNCSRPLLGYTIAAKSAMVLSLTQHQRTTKSKEPYMRFSRHTAPQQSDIIQLCVSTCATFFTRLKLHSKTLRIAFYHQLFLNVQILRDPSSPQTIQLSTSLCRSTTCICFVACTAASTILMSWLPNTAPALKPWDTCNSVELYPIGWRRLPQMHT